VAITVGMINQNRVTARDELKTEESERDEELGNDFEATAADIDEGDTVEEVIEKDPGSMEQDEANEEVAVLEGEVEIGSDDFVDDQDQVASPSSDKNETVNVEKSDSNNTESVQNNSNNSTESSSSSGSNSSDSKKSRSPTKTADPKITTEIITKTERISFQTVEKKDEELEKGKTRVSQDGKNGERTITYEITYADEELISKEEINQEVTTEPIDKIIKIGTKEVNSSTIPTLTLGETYSDDRYDIKVTEVKYHSSINKGPEVFFEVKNKREEPLDHPGSLSFKLSDEKFEGELNSLGYTINFNPLGFIYQNEKRSGSYHYLFDRDVKITEITYHFSESGFRKEPIAKWVVE